jgi:hypothetical protein
MDKQIWVRGLAVTKLLSLSILAISSVCAQQYTRGIGVYPGDPQQYFGPSLEVDATSYRNLALHRPARHSSSYDSNLTAQLITDGIKATVLPRTVVVSTSEKGTLPKIGREFVFDHNPVTSVDLAGKQAWIQIELRGGEAPPTVDRLDVEAASPVRMADMQVWDCLLKGSDDGKEWKELGRAEGIARPMGYEVKPSIRLAAPAHNRFYRVEFHSGRALGWRVDELAFFNGNRPVNVGGPYDFTSSWMSAGASEEWVYVDLGAPCTFDRVALYWILRAAEGSLQVSDDAVRWTSLQALPASPGNVDDIRLAQPAHGRYVRVLMRRASSPSGYALSEMEVWGRGGPVPHPKQAPAARPDGRLDLAGGAWRLQRDSLVRADGEALSQPGFPDDDWMIATVPGTVLASYFNAGALPDPNFGDNQAMISDSFFYADFWYRNEFVAPSTFAGGHVWLNFDGINWKADVFLNGQKIGRIEGAFTRSHFDVSRVVRPGGKNAIAVRVIKNATPGSVTEKTFDSVGKNGGALGADNPTFHASVGWDWIPTIRGRNSGIWDDVWLSASGPVTLDDPFVKTTLPLPDLSSADVALWVTIRNRDARPVNGTLHGRFGDVAFEKAVTLAPSETRTINQTLHLGNPKLWWPNGYGEANLYDVELKFETGGAVSDAKSFQAGVRQFTYSEDGGALKIWVNGRRFIPRGGNWGFGESMLRYRAREFDAAVRYHRDMNFTMIRNWVGQMGDDAFYEACDRYGIVVWQDFWLANPWDGPNPDDNTLFLRNVDDFVHRIRNHPSVGLYCGRNEGYPPEELETGIRRILAESHPGLYYIPSSADDGVSGHGPYQAMPAKYYFTDRATPKLHSELGMPNIVTLDSLRAMMPEAEMWPQGRMWGLHDFALHGAQAGETFRKRVEASYGGATNVADWVELAQFINYDGHRAMFEAQSRFRMGLLMWMSHPAWTSLTWQTYDYFLEPGAAYFACKKASEPLHIQWNPVTDSVEVVNYSAGNRKGLTARAEIRNLDGALQWEKTASVASNEDSVESPFKMEYPAGATPVQFIRLQLNDGDRVVSTNFYLRGADGAEQHGAIRGMPKAKLEAATQVERQGQRWRLTTELHNASAVPALMVRVKAVRETTGDRILPVLYSENYVALMPGERQTITTDLADADTRGERPRIVVEGFNLLP